MVSYTDGDGTSESINSAATGVTAYNLVGGTGNDVMVGTTADDYLDGSTGNDNISGGNGNDILLGGQGSDILKGGNDNDSLRGGTGNDALTGGNGRDIFVFEASASANGADLIFDFTAGNGANRDVLDLSAFFGAAGATIVDGNTGSTTIDPVAAGLLAGGNHFFVATGTLGATATATGAAAALAGYTFDNGSKQAILFRDVLTPSTKGYLYLGTENLVDGNRTLEAAELRLVATVTMGNIDSTTISNLLAENLMLQTL